MLTGQPRFQSGWQVLRVGLILGNGQHVHTHTHTHTLFFFFSLFLLQAIIGSHWSALCHGQ